MLTALCVAVFFCAGVYSYSLKKTTELLISTRFYFLVSSETSASVSALQEQAYLNGGAGYLLERKEGDFAVYACYLSVTDAEQAAENLTKKKQEVVLYQEEVERLYLNSMDKRNQKQKIVGYLNTLKSCIALFGEIIKGAEIGEYTQNTIKELLESALRVLRKLATDNQAEVFQNSSSEILGRIAECYDRTKEVVFCKDLRFMQAALCDLYLNFCFGFSL